MSSSFDRFQKRRLILLFSVVLSVFLVLFYLGVLGLLLSILKKQTILKENCHDGVLQKMKR
jgi:cell division transport system permease protein